MSAAPSLLTPVPPHPCLCFHLHCNSKTGMYACHHSVAAPVFLTLSLPALQFQDLILLSEGRMVYFGKAEDSVGYFATRGFRCPEHYNPGKGDQAQRAIDRLSRSHVVEPADSADRLSLNRT